MTEKMCNYRENKISSKKSCRKAPLINKYFLMQIVPHIMWKNIKVFPTHFTILAKSWHKTGQWQNQKENMG